MIRRTHLTTDIPATGQPRFRHRKPGAILLALALSCVAATTALQAQQEVSVGSLDEATKLQIDAIKATRAALTPAQQKITSQLLYARKESLGLPAVAGAPGIHAKIAPEADGRYKVKIIGTVTPELLAMIKLQGGEVLSSFPEYSVVYALLPLASLETVAGRGDVQFIKLPPPLLHNDRGHMTVGNSDPDLAQAWVESAFAPQEVDTAVNDPEGDATHAAKAARTAHNISGAGVKVGVLSDSIDNGKGALAAAKKAGYVPAALTVLAGQAGPSTGEGEGLAMCEIVHRIAPGAALYFASGDGGEEQFAKNINTMVADGCKVIIDDISYGDESPFQDSGPIAQAADAASAKGVLYFSCAANFNNLDSHTPNSSCWEGDFVSKNKDGFLSYDAAGTNTNGTESGFNSIAVVLFWAEAAGKATSQYNLYEIAFDSSGNGTVVQEANDPVSSTREPIQFLSGFEQGHNIAVELESGAARFVHVDVFAQDSLIQFATAGRVRGHNCANAANAYCVAATPASSGITNGPSGPYPGVFNANNQVEPFSDDGLRRVFFTNAGVPITAGNFLHTGGKVLAKPDFTAADGVTTSLPKNGGLNPFFGTSAAAPHAGALAALLLSYKPGITPAAARTALQNGCVEITKPGVSDRDAGKGILLATKIITAAGGGGATAAPVITSAATATATEGKAFTYKITASNSPTSFGCVGTPAGLKLNATTGVISGTPTVSGKKMLTLKATNAKGTGTKVLTLIIAP